MSDFESSLRKNINLLEKYKTKAILETFYKNLKNDEPFQADLSKTRENTNNETENIFLVRRVMKTA